MRVKPEQEELKRDAICRDPLPLRRVGDKLIVAFHVACDGHDLNVAAEILKLAEFVILRRPLQIERRLEANLRPLIGACERLWRLRHEAGMLEREEGMRKVRPAASRDPTAGLSIPLPMAFESCRRQR